MISMPSPCTTGLSCGVGALTMPVTLIAAELDHVATVSAMTALVGPAAERSN